MIEPISAVAKSLISSAKTIFRSVWECEKEPSCVIAKNHVKIDTSENVFIKNRSHSLGIDLIWIEIDWFLFSALLSRNLKWFRFNFALSMLLLLLLILYVSWFVVSISFNLVHQWDGKIKLNVLMLSVDVDWLKITSGIDSDSPKLTNNNLIKARDKNCAM